jgi:IPT/TIG domain
MQTTVVVQVDWCVPNLPFGDTFAPQNPVVTSANPTCVNAGDTFTINGTGFYPSLVTSVTVGKQSAAPYTASSDKLITAVAPILSGYSFPVIVQTGVGISNDSVKIEVSDFGLCQ